MTIFITVNVNDKQKNDFCLSLEDLLIKVYIMFSATNKHTQCGNSTNENCNNELLSGLNINLLANLRLTLCRRVSPFAHIIDKDFVKNVLKRTVVELATVLDIVKNVFDGKIDVTSSCKDNGQFNRSTKNYQRHQSYFTTTSFDSNNNRFILGFLNVEDTTIFQMQVNDINNNLSSIKQIIIKFEPNSKYKTRSISPYKYGVFDGGLLLIGTRRPDSNPSISTFLLIYSYEYGFFHLPFDINNIIEFEFLYNGWKNEMCIYYKCGELSGKNIIHKEQILFYCMESKIMTSRIELPVIEQDHAVRYMSLTNINNKWLLLSRWNRLDFTLNIACINLKDNEIEETVIIKPRLMRISNFKFIVDQFGKIGIVTQKKLPDVDEMGNNIHKTYNDYYF